MKSFLLKISILSITYIGCIKKESKENCIPEKLTMIFQTNKQLDTVTHRFSTGDTISIYKIVDGGHLVFKYEHTSRICPDLIDGGGSLHIVFQVPPATTAFIADDSTELRQLHLGLQFNSWTSQGFKFITIGSLEGQKKNNNTWHIKASLLTSNSSAPLSFEADFIKQ